MPKMPTPRIVPPWLSIAASGGRAAEPATPIGNEPATTAETRAWTAPAGSQGDGRTHATPVPAGGLANLPVLSPPAWDVLLVDDDLSVHRMARLVLRDLRFKDRPLALHEARSPEEARALLAQHPGMAVAIVDVMMEGRASGLELVAHIRGEMGNRAMRIVISTGQIGLAPELSTVSEHEINGYLNKAQIDSGRICGVILASLRAFSEIDELRGALRHISRLAMTDSLTGLSNRLALQAAYRQAVSDARRVHASFSLVFVDLDGFKAINDQQGHRRGDQILQSVGTAILAVSRGDDRGFRYGGDEFVVVLPNCTAVEARQHYLPRLSACLARFGVAASFGVSEVCHPSYKSMEAALQDADRDMYATKHQKRMHRRRQDHRPPDADWGDTIPSAMPD